MKKCDRTREEVSSFDNQKSARIVLERGEWCEEANIPRESDVRFFDTVCFLNLRHRDNTPAELRGSVTPASREPHRSRHTFSREDFLL